MLALVRTVLNDLGLATAPGSLAFNVFANPYVNCHVFVDPATFYVIKIRSNPSLLIEHRATHEAFAVLGESVPEPIGFRVEENLGFLVCRGRPHVGLTLSRARHMGDAFTENIVRYLDRTDKGFRIPDSHAFHSFTLRKLLDEYAGTGFVAVLARWLEGGGGQWLDSLPHIKQHGDFSGNNLGIAGQQLIYFDWEDFGHVTLPGFDVVILAASCLGFEPAGIVKLVRTDRPRQLAVVFDHLRTRLGLDRDAVLLYILVCLVTFLDLKQRYRYGQTIIDRVRILLDALARTCSHTP
jgi:hypothetical protein